MIPKSKQTSIFDNCSTIVGLIPLHFFTFQIEFATRQSMGKFPVHQRIWSKKKVC